MWLWRSHSSVRGPRTLVNVTPHLTDLVGGEAHFGSWFQWITTGRAEAVCGDRSVWPSHHDPGSREYRTRARLKLEGLALDDLCRRPGPGWDLRFSQPSFNLEPKAGATPEPVGTFQTQAVFCPCPPGSLHSHLRMQMNSVPPEESQLLQLQTLF